MAEKRNAAAEVNSANAPEIMMPQESRAELDRLAALMSEQLTTEQWVMKVFLQGMEFQRALTAAGAAVAGA